VGVIENGEHSLSIYIWIELGAYCAYQISYCSGGINIHQPAIIGYLVYQGFDSQPYQTPVLYVDTILTAKHGAAVRFKPEENQHSARHQSSRYRFLLVPVGEIFINHYLEDHPT